MKKSKEQIAERIHNIQSELLKCFLKKCLISTNGTLIIPKDVAKKYIHHASTSYNDLTETEKENNRREADGILRVLNGRQES